jgi:alcohol dehydrogenase
MRAALLTAYASPLSIANVPDPQPAAADAVIRVDACGICRSDWHVWSGDWTWRMPLTFPHIMGHEVAGTVVAAGRSVQSVREGMRVTLPFHLNCGRCASCLTGASNLCVRYTAIGFQLAGGFAEMIHVPNADTNLLQIPDGLSTTAAAALGCRFTSAYHGLADQVAVQPGETVVVFGCGGLGLSAIQIATALDARVIAVDAKPAALARARDAGAHDLIQAGGDESAIIDEIRSLSAGGTQVSVDALGSERTMRPAIMSLQVGGRHLQLGLTGAVERGTLSVPVDTIVKRELRIVGSVGCPRPSFERLLLLVESGRVQPERLLAETVTLEGISDTLVGMSSFATAGFHMVLPG